MSLPPWQSNPILKRRRREKTRHTARRLISPNGNLRQSAACFLAICGKAMDREMEFVPKLLQSKLLRFHSHLALFLQANERPAPSKGEIDCNK